MKKEEIIKAGISYNVSGYNNAKVDDVEIRLKLYGRNPTFEAGAEWAVREMKDEACKAFCRSFCGHNQNMCDCDKRMDFVQELDKI